MKKVDNKSQVEVSPMSFQSPIPSEQFELLQRQKEPCWKMGILIVLIAIAGLLLILIIIGGASNNNSGKQAEILRNQAIQRSTDIPNEESENEKLMKKEKDRQNQSSSGSFNATGNEHNQGSKSGDKSHRRKKEKGTKKHDNIEKKVDGPGDNKEKVAEKKDISLEKNQEQKDQKKQNQRNLWEQSIKEKELSKGGQKQKTI